MYLRKPLLSHTKENVDNSHHSADEDTEAGTTESLVKYESLKAMTDADHAVCCFYIFIQWLSQ